MKLADFGLAIEVQGDQLSWFGEWWSRSVSRCAVESCDVVWRGVVWCGVVWRGVAWCGVVWRGVVWQGVAWCIVVGHAVLCCERFYVVNKNNNNNNYDSKNYNHH